jgi:hypothetical protein
MDTDTNAGAAPSGTVGADVLPFAGVTLFRGEAEAIRTVLKAGADWGYGNMIAYLKREWAEDLMRQGIHADAALAATNVSAYPLRQNASGQPRLARKET